MKSHKEEAEILRSCGIPLGNWLGNGLTGEGFLAKVDLSNLEKLGLREPYSFLVPLFSLDGLKFILAPLKVKPRRITLKTPYRVLHFTWPLERVFDLEGKEILEGKTPLEFLFLSGVHPTASSLFVCYRIKLPNYLATVEENRSLLWLGKNQISILEGVALLRKEVIKNAALKVVWELESQEWIWKIAKAVNWHRDPERFLSLIQNFHDDFSIANLLLSEEGR